MLKNFAVMISDWKFITILREIVRSIDRNGYSTAFQPTRTERLFGRKVQPTRKRGYEPSAIIMARSSYKK